MTGNDVEKAFVTITPDYNSKGKFKIIQPAGAYFFKVTPANGVFNGKPVTLTIETLPDKIDVARRHTSAFAVKMADGWSRPISVEVDSRANPELLAKAREKVIKGTVSKEKKTIILTVDVPEEGYYWLFVKSSGSRHNINAEINGKKEKTQRMVHTPNYCKNPWSALSSTIYQGIPHRPTLLKAGKNIIKLRGKCSLSAFAVTKDADALRLAPDDL